MVLFHGLLCRDIRLFFQRSICSSRFSFETHYEVLQLSRSCSQKDIKTAFIKLSKQYHPDKNTDVSTHTKFVRLNEAYSVLSRPETRREYDLSLVPSDYNKPFQRARNIHNDTDFTASEQARPFRDPSFWENQDRPKDSEDLGRPYYGIQGLKKVSNKLILSWVVVFAIFGVGLQTVLLWKGMVFSRRTLDEKSARNVEILKEVQKRAMEDGANDEMIARLHNTPDAQDEEVKKTGQD